MTRAVAVVVATLLLGLPARGVDPQESPAGRSGWNRESAARYLDEQMDAWLARAKQLQTGQGKAACVSCHTTLPYVLARPALRRAMHVSRPTPPGRRVLEGGTRRGETLRAHSPHL